MTALTMPLPKHQIPKQRKAARRYKRKWTSWGYWNIPSKEKVLIFSVFLPNWQNEHVFSHTSWWPWKQGWFIADLPEDQRAVGAATHPATGDVPGLFGGGRMRVRMSEYLYLFFFTESRCICRCLYVIKCRWIQARCLWFIIVLLLGVLGLNIAWWCATELLMFFLFSAVSTCCCELCWCSWKKCCGKMAKNNTGCTVLQLFLLVDSGMSHL